MRKYITEKDFKRLESVLGSKLANELIDTFNQFDDVKLVFERDLDTICINSDNKNVYVYQNVSTMLDQKVIKIYEKYINTDEKELKNYIVFLLLYQIATIGTIYDRLMELNNWLLVSILSFKGFYISIW